MDKKRISIIGAGNAGLALAAYLSLKNYDVCLFNRSLSGFGDLLETKTIVLKGVISGVSNIYKITDSCEEVVQFSDIIIITVVSTAHRDIAHKISSYLKSDKTILLSPGRTFGAYEFRKILDKNKVTNKILVAETNSFFFACRAVNKTLVDIIGVKNLVLFSVFPAVCMTNVNDILVEIFPGLKLVPSSLITGLENIGAILHPAIMLFNYECIDRKNDFYFYRDLSKNIIRFISNLDNERILIGKQLGIDLSSISDWITMVYPATEGCSLHDKMHNCPAYYNILAPKSINSRYIYEDIKTGLIPMIEISKYLNLSLELMNSIVVIFSELLGEDLKDGARSFDFMDLSFDKFILTEGVK